MREIGGYLCLDTYHLPMKHEGAIALNSGRSCLAYLIKKKNITKIFLPKFLCASVGDICRQYQVEIEYYPIGKDFMPIINKVIDGWMYLVNYYGQISNETFLKFKEKYKNIIIDNIQAYYQVPIDGVDTIYTCRKFFGVTDGAFLYSDIKEDDSLEIDESSNRVEHIIGSFEKGASYFYSSYKSSEEEFENMPVRRMSKLTNNLLHGIDYDVIKQKRMQNFNYLHEKLHELNKIDIITPEGPYMYPFYIDNGADIRNELQQNKIFIPTLWPDVFDMCDKNDLEFDMARNILPIPVDQRYGTQDMEYIVERILKILKRYE